MGSTSNELAPGVNSEVDAYWPPAICREAKLCGPSVDQHAPPMPHELYYH